MSNNAKNIREILENDNYIIPRYQRNYAWGKPEISQLIKDIDEFFSNKNHEKKYYLGSLVCCKRQDGNFELIDGQQRHTTLTLINLVLKNWQENIENIISKPNLKFDSRKKNQNYIENLYKTEKNDFWERVKENSETTFQNAIEIIRQDLMQIENISKFAENFYQNVYLFRVEVPQDTDLNHYFEVMNNRGEQLEKHEIVKALLMGKIKDTKSQEKFAVIWDACADMTDYVYFNFSKEDRKKLFDAEGNLKINSFDQISINTKENDDEEFSLAEIIKQHEIRDLPNEEKFVKDKYKSVIDFPNFLLQVLKIENEQVSLDDKKLLKEFQNTTPIPEEFIFNLLKYRVLFDKFIIKQDLANTEEDKQNWGIRTLNSDLETTIKTFENDEELTKLQTMLYYSDSTPTYNHWVQEILKNSNFEIGEYTEKLWNITKSKFSKDKLSYLEISIFNLYFIDFLLWKLYKEEKVSENLKPLKEKINTLEKYFKSFKFRQITSKEHLLSQEHGRRYGIEEEIYNGIGNLCLISNSQNSKGNKENPKDKRKIFQNDNSSLKRLIMFESFENNEWNPEQIEKHKEEMMILIDWFTMKTT